MPAPASAPLTRLLTHEQEYRAWVEEHGAPGRDLFTALADAVAQEARADPAGAVKLAEALLERARATGDSVCESLAWRAKGNIAFLRGGHAEALDCYQRALDGFAEGDELERGRTLSSMLHPLAMLGERGKSLEAAEQARACFERCGAMHRVARLEINLASVWFREDRFADVLAALQRASEGLERAPEGAADHEAWAAIRVTRAAALIYLARFEEAELEYQQARAYALSHDLAGLGAQADYNVGYLYFLRGQYVKAIRALDQARETAAKYGDKHHLALCDLDQADVCVELSLFEDALQLAHAALAQFQALGMAYEQGKALTNMAVAEQFLGRDTAALELLERAREAFASARNEFWMHLSDLYRAVVLLKLGRCFEAMQLSELARSFFESRQIRTKAIYAGIIAARARAAALDFPGAEQAAARAQAALGDLRAPWLQVQAQVLAGQLASQRRDDAAALEAYGRAMAESESTRGNINFDELRISFMRDKGQLYERYLELLLGTDPPPDPEIVWQHMERAKSRSLARVMAGGFGAIQPRLAEGSRVVHEINRLREELNWYYRQLDPSLASPDAGSGPEAKASALGGVEDVLAAIQQRELHLLRAIRELPDDEYRIFDHDAGVTMERLRARLADTTLIEYFHAGSRFVAVVADQNEIRTVPLPAEPAAIDGALRLLRFQVGKRAMESLHFQRHASAFQHAAESHLRLLHSALIAPLLPHLRQSHLLIVPHGVLHALPFSALEGPDGALVEHHSVSLAPSAAVFALCAQRAASPFAQEILVAAEPHAAANEIAAVGASWPRSCQLTGKAATIEAVRAGVERSRMIHIAAHGGLRGANPYFSALELADGRLNVIDIYNLRLRADLVVLSGCGTALGDLSGGDELIGMTRAFLYAGARAVVASLWDVDDRTTAEFMQLFYSNWSRAAPAQALWQAKRDFRRRYQHPYFWAPFQLIGAAGSAT
ncbi:MAG TPA: CHAT domain-containing tetratricopeptide repeat protein [Terriglobales bacterium]|nr:CHAT domain-containing tetratricopeptide repeat protein [Terriglobales bacterium]